MTLTLKSGFWRSLSICVAVFVSSRTAAAAGPVVGSEFFETRIRPVLVEHCYECHSASAQKVKGGLRLDSREAVRQGGDSGPAVVPGRIDESLLLDALRHESREMPPGKKLPPEVIGDFVKWIELGAPDPRDHAPSPADAAKIAWEAVSTKRRAWWSLLPVWEVVPPEVGQNCTSRPIDRFILHKLHAQGLSAARPAEPEVLIRRISLVLTGLPPAPETIGRYNHRLADNPDRAVVALTEELLASPHFGEHFARHWMDVVRYGDSYGNEWDPPAKGAWRYRDYLIRAFNEDIGFDQLVREQLAGDLLPQRRANRSAEIDESLIGPMFFHLGEHRHGDSLEFNGVHQEMINNKIDAFSKAFLATTVACARCHDHKLDAISQRDYYALASVFMTPRWGARDIGAPQRNGAAIAALKELHKSIREELADRWSAQAEEFANELAATFAHSPPLQGGVGKGGPESPPLRKGGEGGGAPQKAEHPARLDLWRKAFGELENAAKPALDNVAQIGPLLRASLSDGAALARNWTNLAGEWTRLHAAALDFNATNFETLADFRSPDLPTGWAADGDGMQHGYVREGTPLIALDGTAAVRKLLTRGYDTHALSPRLAGALRSPPLQTVERAFVSVRVAGGEWAALRTVPANAFLAGSPEFFDHGDPSWRRISCSKDVNRPDWTKWLELSTAALNANFPGIFPNLRKNKFDPRADTESINGWFSLSGIVTHEVAGSPKDPLDHWRELWRGKLDDGNTDESAADRAFDPPQTASDAWRRVGVWLADAVKRWCRNSPRDGDVTLVNWLLERELLVNDVSESSLLGELVAQYRAVEQTISLPRTVNSMDERGMAAVPYRLDVRGNIDDPGEPVAHDFLEVFSGQHDVAKSTGSGRLELAEFLVSPKNPLTARVYVNRVWQWVFGTGLVSTPDDFGHLGDKPSHPELLDWLALEFMAHGWSTKWLVRQFVLSATFRQGSVAGENALQADPDNRLLHHYPTRRLEAEAIRDAILAVSGRLDPQLFGPAIDPPRNSEDHTKRLFSGPLDGNGRRSIYTKITLMEPPKFLTSFNFPDPKIPTGKRDVTNVPTQALALLNSPFVIAQAEYWAQQLVQERQASPAERLRAMFVRALGREPMVEDLERWCLAVEDFRVRQGIAESQVMLAADIWTQVAHALFITKEFIYYR